jgi:hypothetical protein
MVKCSVRYGYVTTRAIAPQQIVAGGQARTPGMVLRRALPGRAARGGSQEAIRLGATRTSLRATTRHRYLRARSALPAP